MSSAIVTTVAGDGRSGFGARFGHHHDLPQNPPARTRSGSEIRVFLQPAVGHLTIYVVQDGRI